MIFKVCFYLVIFKIRKKEKKSICWLLLLSFSQHMSNAISSLFAFFIRLHLFTDETEQEKENEKKIFHRIHSENQHSSICKKKFKNFVI